MPLQKSPQPADNTSVKKNRSKLPLICVLVILVASAAGSGLAQAAESAPQTLHSPDAYPDTVQVGLLLDIQEKLYNDRYQAAEEIARLLITRYPDDPLGYLFRAIVLVTAMYDAEENTRSGEFHALLDTTELLALAVVKATDMNRRAWAFLALGHVESYRAVWEARFGSKLAAARKARAGAQQYRRGLDADSSLYDLYFGLGLYHYWKSAKAGVLRWVGLIADDKARGIQQLTRAADSSLTSRQAARSALIWIHLDRKEYNQAIALSVEMLDRYPDSRTFLWPLAKAYFETERYGDAATAYERLRTSLATNPGNYHNLIECDYRLAQCYEKMELPQAWAHAAAQAMTYFDNLSADTRDRQKDRIAYLSKEPE